MISYTAPKQLDSLTLGEDLNGKHSAYKERKTTVLGDVVRKLEEESRIERKRSYFWTYHITLWRLRICNPGAGDDHKVPGEEETQGQSYNPKLQPHAWLGYAMFLWKRLRMWLTVVLKCGHAIASKCGTMLSIKHFTIPPAKNLSWNKHFGEYSYQHLSQM